MSKIQHRYLLGALTAIDALQNGRVLVPAREGKPPVRERALKLSAMTGVKLSRLRRTLTPLWDDASQHRDKLVADMALCEEDGTVKRAPDGSALFADPDIEKECLALLREFDAAEVLVMESLKLSDFVRKERDDMGKVYETSDLEAWIIDALADLIEDAAPPE